MAKLNLNTITSGLAATAALNANSEILEDSFDNSLSRDGTSPNQMESNLDMNSNRILNLPDALLDQEPITLAQAGEITGLTVPFNRSTLGNLLYPEVAAESGLSVVDTSYSWGDVRRYGALVDGVANDAGALQDALDSGFPARIPTGTLNIGNTTINLSEGDSIIGEGGAFTSPKTLIKYTGNGIAMRAAGTSDPFVGRRSIHLSGFQIQSPSGTPTCLLSSEFVSDYFYEDITLYANNHAIVGALFSNCHHGIVNRMRIRDATSKGMVFTVKNDAVDNNFSGQTVFSYLQIENVVNAGAGVGLELSRPFNTLAQLTFVNLHVKSNDIGIDGTDSIGGAVLINPCFEANTVNDLRTPVADGGAGIKIYGGHVTNSVAAVTSFNLRSTGDYIEGVRFVNLDTDATGILMAGSGGIVNACNFIAAAGVTPIAISMTGDNNRLYDVRLERAVSAGWVGAIDVSGDNNRIGKVLKTNVSGACVTNTGAGTVYDDAFIFLTHPISLTTGGVAICSRAGLAGNINRVLGHITTAGGAGTATLDVGKNGAVTTYIAGASIANSAQFAQLDFTSSIGVGTFIDNNERLIVRVNADAGDTGAIQVEVEVTPFSAER